MRLKIKYSTRKRIQTKYFLMPTLGILKCVMTAEAEDADKKKDGKEACKCMKPDISYKINCELS